VGERRVREQAVWNQPIARGALSSGQIVPDDSKVVDGRVREAVSYTHLTLPTICSV